jgi:hypothetical protein
VRTVEDIPPCAVVDGVGIGPGCCFGSVFCRTPMLLDQNAKFMPGDWACAACGAHNFRSRQACYKCAGPRLPASSSSSGGGGAAAGLGEGSSTTSGRRHHNSPSATLGRRAAGHASVANLPREFTHVSPEFAKLPVEKMNWLCEKCVEVNFARRTRCFFCDAAKPDMRGGDASPEKKSLPLSLTGSASAVEDGARLTGQSVDGADGAVAAMAAASAPDESWHCPACSVPNAPSRTWCFVCSTDRPADGGGKPAGDGSTGQAANALWVCRTCLLANPRSARFCICGERQPSPEEMDALERGLGLKPPKPTEWACTHCTMLNFVRRERCARCGKPKNASDVPVRVGIASKSS